MTKKGQKRPNRKPKEIVRSWKDYFKSGELEDWQRFMKDLGFEEQFDSKSKCRKELKGVWVNIYDFLDAVEAGYTPRRFNNQRQLSAYTRDTERIYPKTYVKKEKGCPLASLLAHIL